MADFLVVTGLSGAGRSSAAASLEDLGWFVVDNLPSSLIEKIAELAGAPGSTIDRIALVIRGHQADLLGALGSLRASGHSVRILFLEASTAELVRRYGGTRRRHPLADGDLGVADAIEHERALLEALRAEADVVIDTTTLNIHELKQRLIERFVGDPARAGMQVAVLSFGYKHGLPMDVDYVFDCRFLPNPYWVESLRPLSGQDEAVRDHVFASPLAAGFVAHVEDLLALVLPAFAAEGKSYVAVAFGCTGGRHRSVAIAEEIARRLRRVGLDPRVHHRDLRR